MEVSVRFWEFYSGSMGLQRSFREVSQAVKSYSGGPGAPWDFPRRLKLIQNVSRHFGTIKWVSGGFRVTLGVFIIINVS